MSRLPYEISGLLLITLALSVNAADQAMDMGALAGQRHRVLVSTDIGGTDPDDFQSMVHLLLYADVLDIEGLISSPYGPGRASDILTVIERFEEDYPQLVGHSDTYPTPDALRAITKQGETESAPYAGVRSSTDGSRWIVHCARREDPRPLHVLVWGGPEDLVQALHEAPDILEKLRVYWIGGPNKKWGPAAYRYLVTHCPNLWIIESNSTYRGWFNGGEQSGQWGNNEFPRRHIAGRGALGEFFMTQLGGTIKMGDTPSVAWLLKGNPSDPSQTGWGGAYVRAWERPYLRVEGLPQERDPMEIFGILEMVLSPGDAAPPDPNVRIQVENQLLEAHRHPDGTLRVLFSPKAAKTYSFKVQSNDPSLDGKTGTITSTNPLPKVAQTPAAGLSNWWTDDPSPEVRVGEHMGARTVSRWRGDFLRDFAERMNRCLPWERAHD